MKFPPPMHYAVRMAMEDGLVALDAGKAPQVPSGVIASLRTRKGVLDEALAGVPYPVGIEARVERIKIRRVLDALDRQEAER